MTPQTKKCTKCGEVKELTDYYKHRYAKNGIKSICKTCEYHYQKERSKTLEKKPRTELQKEKAREATRRYRERNKDKVNESSKEKMAQFRKENPCTIKERGRRYYKKNKDAVLIKSTNYYVSNKAKISSYRRGVVESLTDSYVSQILNRIGDGMGCPPKELIEQKRLIIKIKRELKKIK